MLTCIGETKAYAGVTETISQLLTSCCLHWQPHCWRCMLFIEHI